MAQKQPKRCRVAILACVAVGALAGAQFWGWLGAVVGSLAGGVLAYCSADGCTTEEQPEERLWPHGFIRK